MYQRLFKGQFFSIILKNFLISVLLISLLCSCVNVEKITYVVILLDPDSYDLQRLRADASFKVNVSLMYNVNWVPVNILGKSNMTNGEIKNLVGKKPEYIQSRIDTLYEVIQYIEIANFKPDTYCDPIDNKIESYGIRWEHHKPGYLAVTTNCGACATIANLLNYLLKDDYEEVGFIGLSRADGGGHVINYIKHEGYYYIIDLTNHRNDFKNNVIETGKSADYEKGRNKVAANIHEVTDLADWFNYGRARGGRYAFSCSYTAADTLPMRGVKKGGWVFITYPNPCKSMINIVYDDPDDKITIGFHKAPAHHRYPPVWEPYNVKY